MKKIIATISLSALVLTNIAIVSFAIPAQASAKNLIPCTGVVTPGDPNSKECTFDDVITLVANLIDFLIFILAPILAAINLLRGGWMLLSSGGSAEQMNEAKSLFGKTIMGLLIAMGAWLIVKTIMIGLGYNTGLFPKFY
jgi:hypothetical protein